MKRRFILGLYFVCGIMSTTSVFAYEVLTHKDFSEHALADSALKKEASLITALGLAPAQQFPGTDQKSEYRP